MTGEGRKEFICTRCAKSFIHDRKKKYCNECKIPATKEKTKEYKTCNAQAIKKYNKKYSSAPEFKKRLAEWIKKPQVKVKLAASQKKYRKKRRPS